MDQEPKIINHKIELNKRTFFWTSYIKQIFWYPVNNLKCTFLTMKKVLCLFCFVAVLLVVSARGAIVKNGVTDTSSLNQDNNNLNNIGGPTSEQCQPDKLTVYKMVLHTFWSRDVFPKHYPDWRPPAQWSKVFGKFFFVFFYNFQLFYLHLMFLFFSFNWKVLMLFLLFFVVILLLLLLFICQRLFWDLEKKKEKGIETDFYIIILCGESFVMFSFCYL